MDYGGGEEDWRGVVRRILGRGGRRKGDGLSLLQHMRQTQPGSPSRAMRTERFLLGGLSVGGFRERVGDGVHDAADEGADTADKGSGGNGSEATVAFGLLHVSEGV